MNCNIFSKAPHPNPPRRQGGKRVAFTLAEVLITLGIIGVVAAMTIPNLITAHQKKATVTKLQKAISVVSQAYRLSLEENGEPSPQEALDMGGYAYFNKYWAPYLKGVTLCVQYSGHCGYSSDMPFKKMTGDNANVSVYMPASKAPFTTSDGFFYIIYIANYPNGVLTSMNRILVDINGPKGPNTYGKDVFLLWRYSDETKGGYVMPEGYSEYLDIEAINGSCKPTGGGERCAEKIRRAGWQIEKDYPW